MKKITIMPEKLSDEFVQKGEIPLEQSISEQKIIPIGRLNAIRAQRHQRDDIFGMIY